LKTRPYAYGQEKGSLNMRAPHLWCHWQRLEARTVQRQHVPFAAASRWKAQTQKKSKKVINPLVL